MKRSPPKASLAQKDPPVLILWKWNYKTHHQYTRKSHINSVYAWLSKNQIGFEHFRVLYGPYDLSRIKKAEAEKKRARGY